MNKFTRTIAATAVAAGPSAAYVEDGSFSRDNP
jgi:hypothetical protein